MLKTVVLPNILVETLNKELYLIEIEILCKSINVFNVTFNQFNAYLMNRGIHSFKLNLTDPEHLKDR